MSQKHYALCTTKRKLKRNLWPNHAVHLYNLRKANQANQKFNQPNFEKQQEKIFLRKLSGLVPKIGQFTFIAISLQKLLNDAVFFLPDIVSGISSLGCFKNSV